MHYYKGSKQKQWYLMFLHVISDLLFLMFIFGNLKQHITISVTYA